MNSNIYYDPDAMAQAEADKAQSNTNFDLLKNSSLQTSETTNQGNKEPAKSDQTLKSDKKLQNKLIAQIPIEIKANRHGIAIEITEECPMRNGYLKYVLYKIQGSAKKGKFETMKGYHDFVELREKLVKSCFGLRIPDLPRAHIWLNYQPGDAEARRNELAKFLKEITEFSHLYNSVDFQLFLKNGPGRFQEATYSIQPNFEMSQSVNNMSVMPNFIQPSEKIGSLQPFQHSYSYNYDQNSENQSFSQQNNQSQIKSAPLQNQNQIPSITIIGDFQRADSFGVKHKEYHIRGFDETGMFEVNRRYSDFVLIRKILVETWSGVKFQELPSTLKFEGETEEAFQNIRSYGLINFLQSHTPMDSVFHSAEWQTFIKDPSPQIADVINFLWILFDGLCRN